MADRSGRFKDVKIAAKHFTTLIREGLIDYYTPLKEQTDAAFVKAVSKFQSDTSQVLTDLRTAVERKDYESLRRHLECLKVNAISIGARRLESMCTVFKNFCDDKCEQRCKVCVEEANKEFVLVSGGLDDIKREIDQFKVVCKRKRKREGDP
uniref:histidine-containing phosphotransfer protein 1-like n=1 Tax=Erigeron canadensis TaxID=72917 RepID=UPI001CB99586|nr:histidine-containing phosphotransfer protein 1-like [Erigeron canadensis]